MGGQHEPSTACIPVANRMREERREQRADLGIGFGEFELGVGAGNDAGSGVQLDVPAGDQRGTQGHVKFAIAARIASEHGVEAPIITSVALLLQSSITIDEAVASLMARPLKSENE